MPLFSAIDDYAGGFCGISNQTVSFTASGA